MLDLSGGLDTESQVALTTVLTIMVLGHEDTSTTGLLRALLAKADNLTGLIHTVILHNGHLDLLSLMLNLLGSGVSLLLLLLGTTAKA